MKKLSKIDNRNVTKRESRLSEKNTELSSKNIQLERNIGHLTSFNSELVTNVEKMLTDTPRLQKQLLQKTIPK